MNAGEKAPTGKILAAGKQTAGKLCAICQTAIIAGERIVKCSACELPFHVECWEENGGCAQYGCRNAPASSKEPVEETPASQVWGETKPCPSCGQLIKAQAIKCRHCGADFDTADLLTREQYRSREYRDKEYDKVRNRLILLFMFSISGILSIVAAIILAKLMFGGQSFGIEDRRLPPALRLLTRIAAALSVMMLFLLLLSLAFS